MATNGVCHGDSLNSSTQNAVDPIKLLYPVVNEDETPLPRCWSNRDKYNYIGLSTNNLRVYYKGKKICVFSFSLFINYALYIKHILPKYASICLKITTYSVFLLLICIVLSRIKLIYD